MAKRKVNKSQAIREYLSEHPDAMPKDAVIALKARKITVTAAVVSTIKSTMRKGQGHQAAAPVATAENKVTVDDLLHAKALVDKVGGHDAARRLLDVLAKLS